VESAAKERVDWAKKNQAPNDRGLLYLLSLFKPRTQA